MTWGAVVQLGLAGFGLTALWMAMGRNSAAQRWAPVVGLCGQPFWLAYALGSDGWGLVVLVCAYTVVYARGAWVRFGGGALVARWRW